MKSGSGLMMSVALRFVAGFLQSVSEMTPSTAVGVNACRIRQPNDSRSSRSLAAQFFRNLPTRRTHCESRESHALLERGFAATAQCLQATRLPLQQSARSEGHQGQLTGSPLHRNEWMFSPPLRAAVSNAPANTELNPVRSRMPSLRFGPCREFRVALPATEKMSGLFRACRVDRRSKNGTIPGRRN